ncbi:MAG: RagB/SusD family nutrient uptake outer membrane protein [Gemmatimonadaceae bacterium]|nr:RagB/SusD family nutrient uptake outer membrane protein [Gemmatimonadaceae bacterium]
MRAVKLFALLLAAPVLGSLPGCTDLTESPSSSITPENFYKNEDEIRGGLASVYAQLRNIFPGGGQGDPGYWSLSEVSSGEMIVPTRGSDWFDSGKWIEMHTQSWTASSPAGTTYINDTWVQTFRGVARANVLLGALENVTVADEAVIAAELRTLRALYYYKLMDMFGGLPIVTTTEIVPRPRSTRKEVFEFIEKELNEARAVLPATWPPEQNGRMTKGAADAILANMYLNAQVFTGTVTAAGLQPGPVRWQDAITAANRILNSGAYSLGSDWRSAFRPDNHLSRENILVAKFVADPNLGFHLVQTSLHYQQFSSAPWNGFSIVAEAYNSFDPNDERREVILVGPQNNIETGAPACVRPGCAQGAPRLVFTPIIRDISQATESEGARFLKWPADPNHVQEGHGNDFAYFRLGEIYLIKAEAQFELGDTGGALQQLNVLRARVFDPDKPLSSVNRDVILKERLFELLAEGKRRQDLIRHGKFTQPWQFKPQREPYRILMPIPQQQLDANPLLVQNAGY